MPTAAVEQGTRGGDVHLKNLKPNPEVQLEICHFNHLKTNITGRLTKDKFMDG